MEVVEGTGGSAHNPAQSMSVKEQDTSEQVKEGRVKTRHQQSAGRREREALEEASSAPQSQTVCRMGESVSLCTPRYYGSDSASYYEKYKQKVALYKETL